MKETRILMGMPITLEIADDSAHQGAIDAVFEYFQYVDEKFSTYKNTSEITKINKGMLQKSEYSGDMKTILKLAEETKRRTNGYFDIVSANGDLDPSGIVKGWAIYNAAKILEDSGFGNFYIEAGGDIQLKGQNKGRKNWRIGIRNPFNIREIIKAVAVEGEAGIATSGTYIRGQHVYDPKKRGEPICETASLTVIGPNIYEADRFATAAFAMRDSGIKFIESLDGFEGYAVDKNGTATMTSGFHKYVKNYAQYDR